MANSLITVEWLHQNIHQENLIVVDASIESSIAGANSALEGLHIPGAIFFDIKKDFTDHTSPYPNMLPSEEQFQEGCRALGIDKESFVVVYDNMGIYSSPRAWWMLKSMGIDQAYVLDGGLPAWVAAGCEVAKKVVSTTAKSNFVAELKAGAFYGYDEVLETIARADKLVIDARSAGRFSGAEPDPRKNIQSGNIPNSVNLPFSEVLNDGRMKTKEELRDLFHFISADEHLIFTCGSGMTACIALLAADQVLPNTKSVFDGSWTEWADKQNLRIDDL